MPEELKGILAPLPYLKVEAKQIEHWRRIMGDSEKALRAGMERQRSF